MSHDDNRTEAAALASYFRDVSTGSTARGLTHDEEQDCCNRRDAAEQAIEASHRHLVPAIVASFQGDGMTRKALLQAGEKALLQAIKEYVLPKPKEYVLPKPGDPSARFAPWASKRIQQACELKVPAGCRQAVAPAPAAVTLSQAKEEQLFTQRDQARETLCVSNLRLVIFIAKPYQGRGVPLEDVIQEGNLGLFRAVKTFQATFKARPARLSTYATEWIRRAIQQAITTATGHRGDSFPAATAPQRSISWRQGALWQEAPEDTDSTPPAQATTSTPHTGPLRYADQTAATSDSPHVLYEREEYKQLLARTLAQLPPDQQEVIGHLAQNKNFQDINVLRGTHGSAASRLGKRALKAWGVKLREAGLSSADTEEVFAAFLAKVAEAAIRQPTRTC